jgi:hypothetical protein
VPRLYAQVPFSTKKRIPLTIAFPEPMFYSTRLMLLPVSNMAMCSPIMGMRIRAPRQTGS